MDEVRAELKDLPGANIVQGTATGVGGNQKPVIMSVRGEKMAQLQEIAGQVEKIVQTTPGAVDVENSLERPSRRSGSGSTGTRPPTWASTSV